MKIIYGDKRILNNESTVLDLARKSNVTKETAGLLFCRGFDTPEKIKKFLKPGKDGFFDPFLLKGMNEAVNLLNDAKIQNKNVFIFGDYDADGICAVSVLKACLSDFGIQADFTVPERDEGYGLNFDKIKALHDKKPIDLLITVDCGISDREVVEKIKGLGIDVIVTDHHEPPKDIPDTVVIDPKIEGQAYPFSSLAGAGVAYKLGYALIGERANKYLDVVSLATVADSMELIGENRDIVSEGLKIYNSGATYLPLKYLLGDVGRQITAGTLAFVLSPRINAGGRMGDAKCALKLMTTTDEKEIHNLAVKLNEYNIERQVGCDQVYLEAKKKIKENGLYNNRIIMVADENWQSGFIGIVASRLVEEYMRPVIVFAKHGENLKGSSRSVDGINIYEAISSAKDLLVAYGGHAQAAGVTVSKENYNALQDALNKYAEENCLPLKTEKTIFVDMQIEGKFPLDFAREIEKMEPFGIANKRPVFAVNTRDVNVLPIKAGSPHYTFNTEVIEMLDFNGGARVELLSLPLKKTLIFDTALSTFKGKEYLKGYLRNVITENPDFESVEFHTFASSLRSVLLDSFEDGEVFDYQPSSDAQGVVYAVSNPASLLAYPELAHLPKNFFYSQDKGISNKIIICPMEIPSGMNKVVWLDEPIAFIKTEIPTYCNYEMCGYENLEYVDTDRGAFAEVYKTLCEYNGCEFKSSADFFINNQPMENGYQFVFSTEVFLELGLFSVEMGKLKVNVGVKNPLTNSKIYNKVYEIRG